MSGIANTSVEEIADCLRPRKRTCSLLIGAGCSVSAGIPLASGFVNRIREERNAAYRRAKTKTYPDVMAELSDGDRRDLVADAIDKAHINWAHIAIAQLMKNGYVSRVLTTNFDPLVVRACAMVGEFPAVYDFAASQNFYPEYLSKKAVFYLHGQRDGYPAAHRRGCETPQPRPRPPVPRGRARADVAGRGLQRGKRPGVRALGSGRAFPLQPDLGALRG
jgi:hypothetical protein